MEVIANLNRPINSLTEIVDGALEMLHCSKNTPVESEEIIKLKALVKDLNEQNLELRTENVNLRVANSSPKSDTTLVERVATNPEAVPVKHNAMVISEGHN